MQSGVSTENDEHYFTVLCIVIMFGTLDLGEIVEKQAHYWLGFIPAWNVFTPLTAHPYTSVRSTSDRVASPRPFLRKRSKQMESSARLL